MSYFLGVISLERGGILWDKTKNDKLIYISNDFGYQFNLLSKIIQIFFGIKYCWTKERLASHNFRDLQI